MVCGVLACFRHSFSHRVCVFLAQPSEGSRAHLIVSIPFASNSPQGKLLSIMDIPTDVLSDLQSALDANAIRQIESPMGFTLLSDGIPVPAPAPDQASFPATVTEPEITAEEVPAAVSADLASETETQPLPPSIIKGDTRVDGTGFETAAGGPTEIAYEKASRKGAFNFLGCQIQCRQFTISRDHDFNIFCPS